MTEIGPNALVVLDYVLEDDDGDVLDASDAEDGEPMVYVHGYGMIVPGLEKALAGLRAGETKRVVVSCEEGYGERDEDLVLEVDRSELPRPREVAVGDELVAESPDGDEAVMRVVEVKAEAVVLDANHPLAGETLHYAVTVREVRPASEAGIAAAASAFEAARAELAPEGSEPALVQLGARRT